jgi:cob(I)alamin adenosyltransferase
MRLAKIYTRNGDQGGTALADGSCLPKDAPRIEALGEIDELNCLLGLLMVDGGALSAVLENLQQQLFELGGELAVPGRRAISAGDVAELERLLDDFNSRLPPLREFVLPGGNRAAALCHLARAVCRRAERRLVTLARHDTLNPESLRFLNRLSDLLFVLARTLAGGQEILWRPRPAPGASS